MPSDAVLRVAVKRTEPLPDLGQLPPDALLTRTQVSNITGFAPQTLKAWSKLGRGPKVTPLEGRPRHRVADVRAWIGLADA